MNNTRNSYTFCTIITSNYLPYAQALQYSLSKIDSEIDLQILISDLEAVNFELLVNDHCVVHFVENVCRTESSQRIFNKYHKTDYDCFRWSMKPVFLEYLIEVIKFDKVIYVDSDICFFNDYSFLFNELDTSSILLSPHWRSSDPKADPMNFKLLFTDGVFNGGFIGASKNGIGALQWLSTCCAYKCVKEINNGFYVDQKYLDALPAFFDDIGIIRHQGCNVANWNQVECKRSINQNGEVVINDNDAIIFIHFTSSTIRGIIKGNDPILMPNLLEYQNIIKQFKPDFDFFTNKYKLKRSFINNDTSKTAFQRIFLKIIKFAR